MKRILQAIALVCAVLFAAYSAQAQNYTAVSASQIGGSGNLISTGQLCFLGTDANNKAVNFTAGGGQNFTSKICTPVTNGAITGFQVPNPLLTIPMAIRYHITAYNQWGVPVVDYPEAWICGMSGTCSTFNFDAYVPTIAPPFGQSITTLAVQDLTVVRSCSMSTATGCGSSGGTSVVISVNGSVISSGGATFTMNGNPL